MTYGNSESDVAKYMFMIMLRSKYFKEHLMTNWQGAPYPYDHGLSLDTWNAMRDKVNSIV
ncbi:hypothetical protein [Pseudomonas phage LUZ7]|uniref:Uncharacterized protein n=1 Tax=Pseudomonas phage LUZ7 TaxID=655097 RepID=C8ZKJ6_9CAUD|nr:hypothetical protein PP-LUZ7_gp097 [Pseudomonas phage LUZ7]CAZ66238.1 hypothetical protein [Pseudomonas phage LUZ7]